MKDQRPIIGITLGDPVGVGPEIIHMTLGDPAIYDMCKPCVFGDRTRLEAARHSTGSRLVVKPVKGPEAGMYKHGRVDLIELSGLDPKQIIWGRPTVETGNAMVKYITAAVAMAKAGRIAAIVTCPINKSAMHSAGFRYSGHTELLAEKTGTDRFVMMLAGKKLRVVLVTAHTPLRDVPSMLSVEKIYDTIRITAHALQDRFGIEAPRIAVAGLNPHAGEQGLFGDEEDKIISPAVQQARKERIDVHGPLPPDTLFTHAKQGQYDVVVCMYHDQGLIPFKMIHFTDGVNTTLGLPIIRTSVDHGTAYDIAGTGKADPGSLVAAIQMAAEQAVYKKNP
ncbi:4-hydroxythreonine-4-phosphate dehydrogenase PdxA [Thermodesulfobacteriota bacterium]